MTNGGKVSSGSSFVKPQSGRKELVRSMPSVTEPGAAIRDTGAGFTVDPDFPLY